MVKQTDSFLVGHMGSETRSQTQILEKTLRTFLILFSRNCQSIHLYELYKIGSWLVKLNLKEFLQEQKLHSKRETWAILRSFGYSSLISEPDMIL